ncbi:MAG: TPM domain-containing protein [Verrucomicrobiae bacterium]|nr:TPM domain-containing protein [Verrucomicrobiae bacterium]
MNNANNCFSSGDREHISQRIAKLEQQTDAEVVCAVATESGRYDRAESLCGLAVGLMALISGNKLAGMGGWDTSSALSLGLQVVLVVGGFVLGSVLASYWHGLRSLFTSNAEMASEVSRSVHQVFSQCGIGGTRQRGGVLIYLSLFERRLEVRCDRAVAGKVKQPDLDAIRDAVLDRIRAGDAPGGIIAGLDRAAEVLARAIPATGSTTDSLSNDLITFHPRP